MWLLRLDHVCAQVTQVLSGTPSTDPSDFIISTMAFKFTTIKNFIKKIIRRRRPFRFIPQEILDLIISSLSDDKASLLSCALVHPTWTSISRYHLRPRTLVVSSPSRAQELTELLRSSHETLSSSITGIKLLGSLPFNEFSRIITSPSAISYSELLHVLEAKGITLRSGAVVNDSSLVRLLVHYFPGLTILQVCASCQHITSCMCALSGTFPRLAELTIELNSDGLAISDVARLYGLRLAKPCLRTLRVVAWKWNNELMRWLGDNIVGTLECLELKSTSMYSVWSTSRVGEAITLIQRNKATLRDLRLTFMKFDAAFDLSGLVHLQNLEVASGLPEAELVLRGWRLPRSLKTVYVRNAFRMFRVQCGCAVGYDSEILFEGASLQGLLGS
ncbi:hypothetical protein BDZ89DRAFT_772400 [Hymenopellis radicata]|nr:hypothetical protein BDZ89DRAFT_772400 [Hymenopellis radicata]